MVEAEAQGVMMHCAKVGVHSAQVPVLGRGGANRSLLQALAHQGHSVDAGAPGSAVARDAALVELKQGGYLPVGEAGGAQAQAPETGLGLTPGRIRFELAGEGRWRRGCVAAPCPPPGTLRQRLQLPQRRSGRLLYVGERLVRA